MKKKLYLDLLFLIILGMFTSLSLPPFNYFIINFLTFSLFFVFLFKKDDYENYKFFLYGWSFGYGYFITNLYWISISLTFDESFKFLIPISFLFVPAFLAIFYGLITYIFSFFNLKSLLSRFFLFSLLFGLVEFIRGYILTGFPWNLIVFSLSEQIEFIRITSIIGTYGLNIFCISLFTVPALFFLGENRNDKVVCIFFLVFSVFVFTYGNLYEKNFLKTEKKRSEIVVRAVGSNINLDRFYKDVDQTKIINDLVKISKPDLNKKTLFLWPEGIIPDVSQNELVNYRYLFENRFNENHLIGLGITNKVINDDLNKFYNSLSVYDNNLNLKHHYNKNKLVPFGEFLPLENILSKIGLKVVTNNYQSFSKGYKRDYMNIEGNGYSLKILPLICYEVIYSGNIFKDSSFDIIVNISEDGWFGNSIGPKQHFVHSIFRSIESGKYLIRSANNGIAAIINPVGIIEKQVSFGQDGFVDFQEFRNIKPTIFSKFGNKIFLLIILLYIFLIISFNRNKNE